MRQMGSPLLDLRRQEPRWHRRVQELLRLMVSSGRPLNGQRRGVAERSRRKDQSASSVAHDLEKDIKARTIKAYVKEAIELQIQGKEIKPDRNKPLNIPPELQQALSKNTKARQVFETLTKGRQREYADYIAAAKREETKASRLKKILPMITASASLHDKYRS